MADIALGSEARDSANATFEGSVSQLEEQGYSHEIISGKVVFLRESVVEEEECGPSARIAEMTLVGGSGRSLSLRLGVYCPAPPRWISVFCWAVLRIQITRDQSDLEKKQTAIRKPPASSGQI
jgi:hypothetical protein